MIIVVGIGNPGRKYAGTRHNVGFQVVDALALRHGFDSWRRRFHSRAAEGRIVGVKALLMKPETYVNESGRAVQEAMAWCRVMPHDVMIVCDDFNLALGQLRVRGKGRSGGHNGLASIMTHIGTEAVPRLRVGIGSDNKHDDRDFVLSRFAADERKTADEVVGRAASAVETWLQSGLEECQNVYNVKMDATSRKNKEEADS